MRGDSTRLAKALINLLSNAVKFTRRGFVRLRGERLRKDGAWLQVPFEVQDSGEGNAPSASGSGSRPSRRPTARPPDAVVAPAWAWR